MKQIKKICLLRRIAVLLLGAVLGLTSCSVEETTDDLNGSKQKRTIVVYMSARNSLYANATADSLEIVNGAASLKTGEQMLVFLCRNSLARLYQVTRQSATTGMKLVMQYSEELNASDPEVFGNLMKYIRENFPSDTYGLVMWSHSDGWLPSTNKIQTRGFGVDAGSDASIASDYTTAGKLGYQMDLTDMAEALTESGLRPEFIFFDSCLMQCIEAAYALRGVTDYIVASPAQIPGVGAQYDQMMANAFYKTPFDPQTIVTEYVRQASEGPEYGDMGVVLSVIKTSELEQLAQKTSEMLERYVGPEEPDMSGVLAYDFYRSNSFYRPEYYDLQETMRHLITNDADFQEWQEAMNRCVIAHGATPSISYWYSSDWSPIKIILNEGCFCGVSMFVPQTRYTTNGTRCLYGDLNQAFSQTEWYSASGWDKTGVLETVVGDEG